MTELEKRFYKLYEIPEATIEQYGAYYWVDTIALDDEHYEHRYKPIDDSILLKLICFINISADSPFVSTDVDSLKQEVLQILCNGKVNKTEKEMVQGLFK